MYTQNFSFNNNEISTLVRQAGPAITGAVRKASASTGVDFAYLMEKASAESSFRANAKSKTSSATGLYQFIEKTWMSMVKKYGDKYGMGQYADKIDGSGRCSDPGARRQILSLRNDPEKAACMAAEYAAENGRYLQEHTNGEIGSTELYLAHFMGASGASQFLNALDKNPGQKAAGLFPEAARANRAVFYDAETGKARSLQDVYAFFDKKFQADEGSTAFAAGDAGSGTSDVPALASADGGVPAPSRVDDIIWNTTREDALRILAQAGGPRKPSSGGETVADSSAFAALRHSPLPPLSSRMAMDMTPVSMMVMASLDAPARATALND